MKTKTSSHFGLKRLKEKRRKLFLIRFYIVLFIFLFSIFGLALLSGQPKFVITDVVVENTSLASVDEIKKRVESHLTGRYGYLFAKNNVLIFPRFSIKADLLSQYKIFEKVNLSIENWQTLKIQVIEYGPAAVWCGETVNLDKADCYFMNENGYIFYNTNTVTGNLFIKYYGLLKNQIPLGQYFLPTVEYKKLTDLIQIFKNNDIRVVTVLVDSTDYHLYLESGLELIFARQNDLWQSVDNMFTAVNSGEVNLQDKTLKYLDLRLVDKVIVGRITEYTNDTE